VKGQADEQGEQDDCERGETKHGVSFWGGRVSFNGAEDSRDYTGATANAATQTGRTIIVRPAWL